MRLKEDKRFTINDSPGHMIESYKAYRKEHIQIEKRVYSLVGVLIGVLFFFLTLSAISTSRGVEMGTINVSFFFMLALWLPILYGYMRTKALDKKHAAFLENDLFKFLTLAIKKGSGKFSDELIMLVVLMEKQCATEIVYPSGGYDIILVNNQLKGKG